jgi:Zn-dependent protease
MRDVMSWSIPVFRVFGIQVKVHIFYFLVTIGLFLRVVLDKNNSIWWGDVFLFTIVLLFAIILLHEFGHCFGARYVGGEAKEVLIWPLGGLAFNEIPHGPRPLFITVAAGPAVNLAICILVGIMLATGNFFPNMNPFSNPYISPIHNFQDGRDYTSTYGMKLYRTGTNELVPIPDDVFSHIASEVSGQRDRAPSITEFYTKVSESVASRSVERALAPLWVVWLNRIFWLSWVLFLFNLLPAYPLDGGQLLQSVVWARTDYRRGVLVAAYSGFVVAVLFILASIIWNETLLMGLSLFMLYSCSLKLFSLETEDGPFGYDFSAGYTSLERDNEPPQRPKRPGPLTRWWQARKARKLQREVEQRARDEERMDQLLAKIAQTGKNSLTDDERRFLERVSARYRNRS